MYNTLLDLGPLSCGCQNRLLETFGKALSEDGHDVWEPHHSPWVRTLIELFTRRGLDQLDKVHEELDAWMQGKRTVRGPAMQRPGFMDVWTPDELKLVRLYLETLPPNLWQLEDYDYLVDYLIQRYLPVNTLMTEADWLATKAHYLGKAQAYYGNDFSVANADRLLAALPNSFAQAVQVFGVAQAAKNVLAYGRLHACENVRAIADAARHDLKNVVLDHVRRKLNGDTRYTPQKLEQNLLDEFNTLNRDWRRIALTETSEIANQGLISALGVGRKVRRLEQYRGACGFCRKLNGRVFNIVSPDDPNKNGETDVWEGKTNVGRSSSPRKRSEDGLVMREPDEMWWPAAGVQHPHCRGEWIPEEPEPEGSDPAFEAYLRGVFNIKSGLSLSEWSARHGA
jgi:hypothetical protein